MMGGPLTGAAMNPALVRSGGRVGRLHQLVRLVGRPADHAIVGAVIYRYALAGEAEPDVTPATPEG